MSVLKKILNILFVSLLFTGTVFSTEDKDRLAVMDLVSEDNIFDEKTKTNITDYIFTKFQSTKSFLMIPKADRDTALEQALEETTQGSRSLC